MAADSRDTPYLSVVATTRNDDHGGDPLERLQAFVNTFDAQCRRTKLNAEVVVVEWNPPADRPRLYELIRMPYRCAFPIRFVEVPSELHGRLAHANVLPLFQMIGKNVGIRRARGRFILSTNIDIIFSTDLVDYLASGQLTPAFHYRVDRHDIKSDYPVDAPLDEQMAYCATNQLRLHTRTGTHHVDRFGNVRALDPDIVDSRVVSLGDGWHIREGDHASGFFRWVTPEAWLVVDRTADANLGRGAVLEIEVGPNPYQPESWVDLEILDGDRRLAQRRVSRRMRLLIALDDGVARHEIMLRMVDSSGGRESLPVFERRQTLGYRAHHAGITVVPEPGNVYDLGLWKRASVSQQLVVEHTPAGVEVTTAPGKYSYCASYGPFESPSDGRYEFRLGYTCTQGDVAFQVLDEVGQRWLPSTVVTFDDGTLSWLSLSVDMTCRTRFSLYVSNNRPDGDGVSRFVIRSVTASLPFDQLTGQHQIRRLRRTYEHLVGQVRRLRAWASSLALRMFRERFEDRIVDESPRVHELQMQLRSLAPLRDLAALEEFLRANRPAGLHQNASGDFQLLAREHWFELHGFAEFAMYSMNIDGLFEAMAHAAGIHEKVLEMPLCIYHLEHEKGSGWTPEGEAILKQRITESGITWLDASTVNIWTSYMQWLQRPMIFNGSNWGFGDVVLPETTLQTVADQA